MKSTIEACDEFLSGNASWQLVLKLCDESESITYHKAVDDKIARFCRKAKDTVFLPSLASSDHDRKEDKSKLLSSLFLASVPTGNVDFPTISSTLHLGESLSLAASTAAARERSTIAQTASRVSKDSDTESSSSKVEAAEKQATGKRVRASPFTSAKDQYEEEVYTCIFLIISVAFSLVICYLCIIYRLV
ncbi:hypothetical protein EON65_38530 [archaeon]|nr:MAG: hypothetical protein EON65_38530 [archaeon]